ncbi:hypothetical protein REPUB_Repub03eG0084500 [Reevesia pubescens]
MDFLGFGKENDASVESPTSVLEDEVPIGFLERIKEDFTKRYGGGKAATTPANSLTKVFGFYVKGVQFTCKDDPVLTFPTVFPAVPFPPVGRTVGSLLGAMLMVLFRVITPDQAYPVIDLPILGL